jgi:uncharacterized protein YdeI (YjbR/CyaY-like superfamily)
VAKTFSATLERTGDRLRWVIIRVPLDVHKVWGVRGQLRVKGELRPAGCKAAGFAFRTSLFPTGKGYHFMMVNKQMQCGAGVRPGMTAHFRMELDTEERVVRVPAELGRAMRASKRLAKYYGSLNYLTRREIAKWVGEAKQAETRRRRAEQMAERLMQTMEAERGDLPPVLELALQRNPKARAGWERMPPSHRRAHLMGILYYRNPESRARRVEKAVAMMVEYAEKRESKSRRGRAQPRTAVPHGPC